MRGLGRISAAIGAAAAGIGAAVFLHPRRGARNRRAAAAVARRQSANVATMLGSTAGARRSRRGKRPDDLADRVRYALTEDRPDAGSFQLTVHKGTVTLRGEVESLDDIDAFEARARAVDGVSDVNNLLRLGASASAAR